MSSRVISVFLIWHLSFPCVAESESTRGHSQIGQAQQSVQGSVYVYGDQSLDMLNAIRILGAVAKPGIHYVPAKTDLVTLISLAGGTTERAEMDEVSIKRISQGRAQVIKIDLEQLVEEPNSISPELFANDTILVPVDKSWVSDNTLRTLSLVTGITSIFLSVVVGASHLK